MSVVSSAAEATHFLLYLNDQTYLHDAGAALADELRAAMAMGGDGDGGGGGGGGGSGSGAAALKILMAHENDAARGGCDFGILFDGRTPQDLLASGIYSDLALALYSGPFFPVSVALVANILGATERGGSGAFTTAQAMRSPPPPPPPVAAGSDARTSAEPSLPRRKTLPNPEMAQALETTTPAGGEAGPSTSEGQPPAAAASDMGALEA